MGTRPAPRPSAASSKSTFPDVRRRASKRSAGSGTRRRKWPVPGTLRNIPFPTSRRTRSASTRTTALSFSGGVKFNLGARVDATKSAADAAKANTDLYFAYNATRRTSATGAYPSGSARLSFRYPLRRTSNSTRASGHTVRVPDARERFFALRRMGSDWVGNPDLKPSRNTGSTLGLSFRARGPVRRIQLVLEPDRGFRHRRGKAKVNPVPGVMNTVARSYQNVDARDLRPRHRSFGFARAADLRIERRIGSSGAPRHPIPELGILSRNLAEMPPLRGRVALRYDIGSMMGEVEGVFSGAQSRIDADLPEVRHGGLRPPEP